MLAQRAVGRVSGPSLAILLADGEPNDAATSGLLAAASSLTNGSLDRSPREQLGFDVPPMEPFGESLRH